MPGKNHPLTIKQFETLVYGNQWGTYEIPVQGWWTCQKHRHSQTFAVIGSADPYNPQLINGIYSIAGFDQLVNETNPKLEIGEPYGNAYHWVIREFKHPLYPYSLVGPFRDETTVPHWFHERHLDIYPYNIPLIGYRGHR